MVCFWYNATHNAGKYDSMVHIILVKLVKLHQYQYIPNCPYILV